MFVNIAENALTVAFIATTVAHDAQTKTVKAVKGTADDASRKIRNHIATKQNDKFKKRHNL